MNNEWLGDVLAAHETGAGVGASFTDALRELEQGHKRRDWMWFIFPQWIGLGKTSVSGHFGVKNVNDAMAFLQHDTLRANYRAVVAATRTHLEQGTHLNRIFRSPSPDDRKFVSSLTLIYLMFNEGYSSAEGQQPLRDDVCEEAVLLCLMLCKHSEVQSS